LTVTDTAHTEGPAARSQAAELQLRNVSKRYPGQDTAAVEELSLTVPAGEICVLVGPSGCGKTTLMRMINRMIEPSGGEILLDGKSVRDRSPSQLRREIGYAIQQVGLFPHLKIKDNIAIVPRLLGWDKQRIRARVDELLELVQLDPHDTRDRYPSQLSGGQQQRVGVARALAADPPLMLMDEPFGAIDPINRERLQNEFLRLQNEIKKTIVFVTHDIDEAIKMGDKIAVLKRGGVLAQFATPAELLSYPADDFVKDFVGADRALKRLALQRVRDIDLWKAATARVGESTAEVRAKLRDADLHIPLLVDDGGKPIGWLDERALHGDRVERHLRSPAEPVVELDDILRDALSDMLEAETQYAAVVDQRGGVAGVLSIEVIGHVLNTRATDLPSAAELVADE
jgi:osmoprotectant transport system ATP-binding protein